jgi:hypothetical protein
MSSNPQPFRRAGAQLKVRRTTRCVEFTAESGKTAASRIVHNTGR